jgi:hypothetical protein
MESPRSRVVSSRTGTSNACRAARDHFNSLLLGCERGRLWLFTIKVADFVDALYARFNSWFTVEIFLLVHYQTNAGAGMGSFLIW